MLDINKIFSELAEYKRIQEETQAVIDGLTDTIKKYMEEQNTDILTGTEHKVTYKPVTQNRVDAKRLQAEKPEIYTAYCTPSTYKRFTFS